MVRDGNEMARLVAETANRLRLIQLDLADEDIDTRRAHLEDRLERTLSSLPPADREPFLELLEARFPTWDRQVEVDAKPENTRSTADQKDLSDASFLVSRLVEVAPGLNEKERQVVRDRLAAAGLGRVAGGWSREAEAALRKQLGLAENVPLDADRLLEAIVPLADCLGRIQKVVWKTWQEIPSRSRPSSKPLKNLSRFVTGEAGVGLEQIAQEVSELQHRVASLLLAIPSGVGEFERLYLEKLSVDEIEKLIDLEKKPGDWLTSREARCWAKYKEQSSQLHPGTIKHEILQALGDHASQLLSRSGA